MVEPSFHTVQLQGWLDRLRGGDLQARDELIRAVAKRLERLAHKMIRAYPNVQRFEDTGDILQNAVMRLLHSLEKVIPDSTRSFMGLAAEHIRRELLDLSRYHAAQCRAAGRLSSLGTEDSDHPNANEPAYEPIGHDDLELWCRFHEAVEKLPVEEREVVSLRIYHGWTEQQIAELFLVSEKTVRRRWGRAAARLEEMLGGQLPG